MKMIYLIPLRGGIILNRFEDIIRQSINETIDDKYTSITFEQIENQNRKMKIKNQWIIRMNVAIGSIVALLLVMLISDGFIYPHTNDRSGKTPFTSVVKPKETTTKKIANNKTLASVYLKKMNFSIMSYGGQKTYNITTHLLAQQQALSIELQTMGAHYVFNPIQIQIGNKTLNNKTISIEYFTISGHWRENYINKNSTKVGVVLLDHTVLGGFTIPNQGESNGEGIWSLNDPMTSYNQDVFVVAKNGLDQKSILKDLYEKLLDKRIKSKQKNTQISKYHIQQIKILNKHAFHGFDYSITYDVYPVYKDKFTSVVPINNGRVSLIKTGKVLEVKKGTYVLGSEGNGGPVMDSVITDIQAFNTNISYDTNHCNSFSGFIDTIGTNQCKVNINGKSISIYAGADKIHPEQGLLLVTKQEGNAVAIVPFPTPTKHGIVTITKIENDIITLEAKDGSFFLYDLKTNAYVKQ